MTKTPVSPKGIKDFLVFEPNAVEDGILRGLQLWGRDWVRFVSFEDYARVKATLLSMIASLDSYWLPEQQRMNANHSAYIAKMDRLMEENRMLVNQRANDLNKKANQQNRLLSLDDNF